MHRTPDDVYAIVVNLGECTLTRAESVRKGRYGFRRDGAVDEPIMHEYSTIGTFAELLHSKQKWFAKPQPEHASIDRF
jgi:hypothetical protein